MIQVVETSPIGDSISHKIVEYARGTSYTIDPNGGLHLYDKENHEFAYYAKGAFSSVVIYNK